MYGRRDPHVKQQVGHRTSHSLVGKQILSGFYEAIKVVVAAGMVHSPDLHPPTVTRGLLPLAMHTRTKTEAKCKHRSIKKKYTSTYQKRRL